jgi:undecaprenyl-diphosphatase
MSYLILGCALIILGILHRIGLLQQLENQLISDLQSSLSDEPWISVFRELWFLGRTSFTVISLLLFVSYQWKLGLTAVIIFVIAAGLETIIKSLFSRPRPFQTNPDIKMLQPYHPQDPSFPSGDTMRAWYLALILAAATGGGPVLLGAGIGLALLVSLGRLIMGVHYLTDVLAGAGLGIMGGGVVMLLWEAFRLI